MLFEPGLGTSAGERDRLASDEPNASLPVPTGAPGSGCRSGGTCRHLSLEQAGLAPACFCLPSHPGATAMLLEPILILELALLGIFSGFLAGLLGIGGGMLMVPFITAILGRQGVAADLAVKMAIATSMATIMFTSISSVRAHHQRGAVRWELVRGLAPGIVLGGALASLGVFALLKG